MFTQSPRFVRLFGISLLLFAIGVQAADVNNGPSKRYPMSGSLPGLSIFKGNSLALLTARFHVTLVAPSEIYEILCSANDTEEVFEILDSGAFAGLWANYPQWHAEQWYYWRLESLQTEISLVAAGALKLRLFPWRPKSVVSDILFSRVEGRPAISPEQIKGKHAEMHSLARPTPPKNCGLILLFSEALKKLK